MIDVFLGGCTYMELHWDCILMKCFWIFVEKMVESSWLWFYCPLHQCFVQSLLFYFPQTPTKSPKKLVNSEGKKKSNDDGSSDMSDVLPLVGGTGFIQFYSSVCVSRERYLLQKSWSVNIRIHVKGKSFQISWKYMANFDWIW